MRRRRSAPLTDHPGITADNDGGPDGYGTYGREARTRNERA
jgi:hypothetical protein